MIRCRPPKGGYGQRRGRAFHIFDLVPGGPHKWTLVEPETSMFSIAWPRITGTCSVCKKVVWLKVLDLRRGHNAYGLLGEIEKWEREYCPALYRRQWPSEAEE